MNDVKTIRITFQKRGRARYISHLDLMRTMTRVMRRAQIPLWYTEGFSKHPYITFAAPLSLGYEGLNETMDFRLEGDMSMEEIVSRLSEHMPEGLSVSRAAPAEMKAGEIAKAEWVITVDTSYEKAFENLFGQAEILVQKRTKKKTFKTVDIKPFIERVTFEAKADGTTDIRLLLPCGENNVNPSLITAAVFGEDSTEALVTRVGVYNADGKLFQ